MVSSCLGPVIQWYRVLSHFTSTAATIAARFSNATMLSKTILMRRTLHPTPELSDAGSPVRSHCQLTWPARVCSSDLVGHHSFGFVHVGEISYLPPKAPAPITRKFPKCQFRGIKGLRVKKPTTFHVLILSGGIAPGQHLLLKQEKAFAHFLTEIPVPLENKSLVNNSAGKMTYPLTSIPIIVSNKSFAHS